MRSRVAVLLIRERFAEFLMSPAWPFEVDSWHVWTQGRCWIHPLDIGYVGHESSLSHLHCRYHK